MPLCKGPSLPQPHKDWQDTYGNSDLRSEQGAEIQMSEVAVKRERQFSDTNSIYIPCPPGKELKTNCAHVR